MADESLSKKLPPSVSRMRWPIPTEGKNTLYLDGSGSARSRRPSPRERFVDYLNRTFYGDNREGGHYAENAADMVDLTPIGIGHAAYDATRAVGEGRYTDAILPGAIAGLPFMGKPAKLIADAIRRRHSGGKVVENLTTSDPTPEPAHRRAEGAVQPVGIAAEQAPDEKTRAISQNSYPWENAVFTDPGKDPPWPRSTPWIAPYRPFSKPLRDFAQDYPNGALSDEAGNLLQDIEGRPLTAMHVAGRRKVGGKDERLTSGQIHSILEGIGTRVERVPRHRLGNPIGRAYPEAIHIWDRLPSDQADVVLGHEFGHILNDLAGDISTKGIERELNKLYSELITGELRPRRLTLPQHLNYTGNDISREKDS